MTYGYVVRPRADRDIDEIADYLAEQSGLDTALLFLTEVYETLSLLATHREIGWHCQIPHRQLTTARTFRVSDRFDKFLIFYQPYQDRVEVVRVLHGAQDLVALFQREGFE